MIGRSSFIRGLLPRSWACHRIKRGPLRGMRICSSWYDYPRAILGTAENQLVRWLGENVREGETWIDVGAHHGYTAVALCKYVGAAGRVFAFEPALGSAGCLARTRAANKLTQLTVVPLALGEVAELRMLQASPEMHGMIGVTPGMRDGSTHYGWGETVYDIAFDHVWPVISGADRRLSGVKVDAQGSEGYVLRGMRETLREHRPRLVVEYHDYADLPKLLDALEDARYARVGKDIDQPSAPATSELLHSHNYEFLPR